MNYKFLLLLPLILLAGCAQKKQKAPASTRYDLIGIDSISLEGYGMAHIKQGDPESLTINTTPEGLHHITISKEGTSLSIKVDTETMPKPHPDITFNVTTKMLTSLAMQGALDFDLALSHAKKINLTAHGSVHGIINVEAEALELQASGATDVTIKGTVPLQFITIFGSVEYDAQSLMSETCRLDAQGATTCKMHCTKKIEGVVSGSSSLYYKGSPTIQVQTLGASRVERLP